MFLRLSDHKGGLARGVSFRFRKNQGQSLQESYPVRWRQAVEVRHGLCSDKKNLVILVALHGATAESKPVSISDSQERRNAGRREPARWRSAAQSLDLAKFIPIGVKRKLACIFASLQVYLLICDGQCLQKVNISQHKYNRIKEFC